jgi:hypothetical protein
MDKNHKFILSPGRWIGEGKISLNMVAEELPFSMSWQISEKDSAGKILSIQEIQIQGLSEGMHNEMIFYDFSSKKFSVEMENSNVGKVLGFGLINNKIIAWEFRENDLNFEGFETYKFEKTDNYFIHGEYITADQLRTQIEGKLWKES